MDVIPIYGRVFHGLEKEGGENLTYDSVEIDIPDNLMERFLEIMCRTMKLEDKDYEMLLDDILTAVENRLKVLKV